MENKYALQKAIKESSLSLSELYLQENNFDLAEKLLLIANFITPNQLDVLAKACSFYHKMRNFEKAYYFASLANELTGFKDIDCLINSAIVSADNGNSEKAIELFNKALGMDLECHRAKFGLAIENLKQRDMAQGWKNYMSRHKCFDIKNKHKQFHKLPAWNGTDRGNIIIYNEQGYGDYIFGLRYLKFISNKFKLVADKNFKELIFKSNLRGNINNKKNDYKCSILDLPAILNKNEYYADSYKEIFRQHKSKNRKNKQIGLVFSGSSSYPADSNRSVHLSKFMPLEKLTNCKFFHINKNYKTSKFCDCTWGSDKYIDRLNHFGNTLDVLYEMDALVTVDTGLAHLAGAIGMPTFVILSKYPDFRWWPDNKQTVWYSSWQIIKQKDLDNWDQPISDLKKSLKKFVTHLH